MEALGFNVPSLIAQIINFTILLVAFRAFLYKPILRMLDERRKKIQEGLAAADRMHEGEAEARQRTQALLEEARRESQVIIGNGQQLAARIQEDSRQQSQREAAQLLERARSEIQMERDSAISEVRRQFAELTIVAAERVIGQSLDRRAHQRLIEAVLAESSLNSNGDGKAPVG